MKLALGSIPYFWPQDRVVAFYERAADWPVDIVYIGETVCPKRRDLTFEDWLTLAERLALAGKEVVLSTLALLEAGSELGALERICSNGRFCVEANDMSAVQLLSGRGPFVAGHPGGVPMKTQEGETLFTMNGVQLLSTAPCNLLGAVSELSGLGVDVLRIAPQPDGTEEAVSAFRGVLAGHLDAVDAEEMLAPFAPTGWCNGYWRGVEGMAWAAW